MKPEIRTFDRVLHIMIYALGCTGAVCFAAIAYLESLS